MFGYEADTVVYIYTFYLQHTKHIFHGRFSLDGTGWFIVTERYVAFSYASLKCFLICVCLNSISWYTEDDATLSFSRTFNHASFNSQHSTHSVGWLVGCCKVVVKLLLFSRILLSFYFYITKQFIVERTYDTHTYSFDASLKQSIAIILIIVTIIRLSQHIVKFKKKIRVYGDRLQINSNFFHIWFVRNSFDSVSFLLQSIDHYFTSLGLP